MSFRIFLAGASGAIGRRLVPLLHRAGHQVTGTTRSPERARELRALGIDAAIVDVLDARALAGAVAGARPDIVIHQLTDLPKGLDPALMADATVRNARVRRIGTANLVDAALAAGARRMVAQSIAWTYAPGREPHGEDDPLDLGATGSRAVTVGGVAALEDLVLKAPPIAGIVLRYGYLYGPGTGAEVAKGPPSLHVDAAAHAAFLALDRGDAGIFNVAEPSDRITTGKVRDQLGWSPDFRLA
jgi:nucleoside-diphosphate-sugar epimerase